MFEELEKHGIVKKTDDVYMVGNVGCYCWKILEGRKTLLKSLREKMHVEYDKKSKGYVISYNSVLLGFLE